MNKADLVDTLKKSRETFHHAIEGLSEEQLLQPNIVGTRSVRDIIAHLTIWEGETVALLYQARQGEKPTTVHLKKIDEDEQNALWHEQTKDRALDMVLSDFEGVRRQSIRRVGEFDDEELEQKGFFPWLKNHSLSELVLNYIVIHEEEHAAEILTWRKQNGIS